MTATWHPTWLPHTVDEAWSSLRVEPLRVRAWLLSPVALDAREGMPLDGLLSWAAVLAWSGMLPDDAFADCPRGTFRDLPLPLAYEGDLALASWGRAAPDAYELVRRKRKRADVEAYGLKGKVPINGGEWKALDLPVPVVATTYVEWWCVGDRGRVVELLSLVHGLGRDRSRGIGHVEGWEVDRVDEDRSRVWEGQPTRAVPVRSAEDAAQRFPGAMLRVTATRAPYWRRDARTLCVVPS